MSTIRISPNGRGFVQADGSPFFWLGDTAWELLRCYSLEEAVELMETRKRQGFSVLQVMVTGVGDGSRPNLEGETPWREQRPETPNEAYFSRADAILERARDLGLVVVLGVFHQLQVGSITPANARRYARWIADRWRELPNLVWTMYPKAAADYAAVCRELAAGLREGDGGEHLITVHPDPAPASSSFLHEEDWLDFNMIQTCVEYERIYPMVRADYKRVPVKPVVMAEGGYEGEEFGRVQTALEIRQQAYWSHLAGGHHSYGHNDCWVAPERWREWVDSPGARSLGVYREALTTLPRWWEWVPDESVIAEGAGSGPALNAAARSDSGRWVLVYLSSPTTVALRLGDAPGGGSWSAEWIDPRNGERRPAEGTTDGEPRAFTTPPGWQDALLLFTAT